MESESVAVSRQREIYMAGLRGRKMSIPFTYDELVEAAAEVMSAPAWAYVMGAAGAEKTMHGNTAAFDSWKILPRVLRDVGSRDISTSYVGKSFKTPFFICPVGSLGLVHSKADLAVASAAAKLGIPFMSSNQSSVSMEDLSQGVGMGPKMFQLYWSNSDELVSSFIRRAEEANFAALVVTVDNTLLGWRSRDLQSAYLPYLHGHGLAHYTSDPVFRKLVENTKDKPSSTGAINLRVISALIQMAYRHPGSTWSNLRSGVSLKSARKFVDVFMKPSLSWSDIRQLREMTDLPIIVKGIQHPQDAALAVDAGVNTIMVSNHGGRQVDGSISSLDALVGVMDAVGGKVDVLFDSGIRSGMDAFKALALGAKAVGIGRPFVLALALAGEQGVRDLLLNYVAEFELTMGLSGCRNVKEISVDFLKRV